VFERKPMYCQKSWTAMRVDALMPKDLPKDPITIPALTVESTPDTWSSSARRNEPQATNVVSVISIR
jgi:hypothetical protein